MAIDIDEIEYPEGTIGSNAPKEVVKKIRNQLRERSETESEVVGEARRIDVVVRDEVGKNQPVRSEALLQLVFGRAVVAAYARFDADGAPVGDLDVLASLHDNRDGPAYSFITADPLLYAPLERAAGRRITDDPATLALTMQPKTHSGATMAGGSTVAMGPASVGKTPLLRWIVDVCNKHREGSAVLLRFGEPLPGYVTNELELARMLMAALLDPAIDVIAVDSIKDLTATMDGALMARGVPRQLMRMLSQWGTVFAALGKTIVVPLNISTDNEDALKEVASGVLSNTTTAIVHEEGLNYKFAGRSGEGKLRLSTTWRLSFKNGVPSVQVGGPGFGAAPESIMGALSTTTVRVSQQDINRTFRISLSGNKDQ